jgi:predicted PolB exonuclease-like 3'-5' exonuclease
MTPILVFDLETVPDVDGIRRINGLPVELPDADVAEGFAQSRRAQTGSDFPPHYLHKVGEPGESEADLIRRFFEGIEKFTPQLVSWNGGGFDLPVLHHRAMIHGVAARRYWDWGDDDREFRYNNYLSRYHTRHIDLMDVLAQFQPRANAPLDAVAKLCGFPGKLGMDGGDVAAAVARGAIDEVRNYCECDVLNTYLLYQRFRLMRGELTAGGYAAEISLAREKVAATGAPHWRAFLAAWDANATAPVAATGA